MLSLQFAVQQQQPSLSPNIFWVRYGYSTD
jgi:hypothetical protein